MAYLSGCSGESRLSSEAGITGRPPRPPDIHVGSGKPRLGPPACTGSTSATEPPAFSLSRHFVLIHT